ncbi:MAG: hypothetical protein ACRDTI_05585 [Mycobacterium sp.]
MADNNRVTLFNYPKSGDETIVAEGLSIRQALQITSVLTNLAPRTFTGIESCDTEDDYPRGDRWKTGRW